MRRSLTVVGSVLVLVLLAVAPAVGDDVACGDVITEAFFTLTHDLGPCEEDGLVAGASNIVIDLGGHTITGDGNPNTDGGGVRIGPFAGNVTVRGGTITGFNEGVVMAVTGGNDILQLDVVGNVIGINLAESASGNVIERNVVRDSAEDGIRVYGGSDGNTVRKNTLIGNVSGISVSAQSDNNIILQNDVANGDFGISVFSYSDDNFVNRNAVRGMALDGIQIDDFSDDNEVFMNESTGNGRDGIFVGPATVLGTVLARNTAFGNGDDGIDIDAPATEVIRNTADDNGDLGIEAVAGVTDGRGNEASGNGDPAQCTEVQCE